MGLYFRKSIRVGPLRFNLSQGGVGVSAGIRGLRLGTGPRGHYVHAGRGGVYYRTSLGTFSPAHPAPQPAEVTAPQTAGGMIPIDSGDLAAMRPTSSAELLGEISAAAQRRRLWPLVALAM